MRDYLAIGLQLTVRRLQGTTRRAVVETCQDLARGNAIAFVAGDGSPHPGDFRSDRGLLLIVDEVQTGLARTGRWFGFQHLGVEPDVVTMAKALGNGMPVGACWARAEVAAAFVPGDHGSTFGGQPLAMSAARATLSVMEDRDAPALAERSGARLRHGLERLPGVASVRGAGLLLAAVLTGPAAADACRAALAAGLVINAPRPDILRFAPSLLVSEAEIDSALAILGPILERLASTGGALAPVGGRGADHG